MVALQHWLRVFIEILSKKNTKSIFNNVVLYLQLSLAVWQIMKLTPLGAIIHGGMGWLLSLVSFPGLSGDYPRLRHFPGRVFRNVRCAVLRPKEEQREGFSLLEGVSNANMTEKCCAVSVRYLGDVFEVKKRGNKLFVNEKMSHYITDIQWMRIQELDNDFIQDLVFVEGYRSFWESVASGGVLTFYKALDCILLDHYTILLTEDVWFIPVNLCVSEEKVIKLLNLAGLFLQAKKVFWFIPALLSIASAVLEFCTPLRSRIYTNINKMFCCSVRFICNKLPYSTRRKVYPLSKWVENLKPSNDIELRVGRRNICAVIGGSAKTHREDATPVRWLDVGVTDMKFHCTNIVLEASMWEDRCLCLVLQKDKKEGRPIFSDFVECNDTEEFGKLCTLLQCLANSSSGSLKSYDSKNNKVHVRGCRESVRHYVESGFPPLYQFKLDHVIVDI